MQTELLQKRIQYKAMFMASQRFIDTLPQDIATMAATFADAMLADDEAFLTQPAALKRPESLGVIEPLN